MRDKSTLQSSQKYGRYLFLLVILILVVYGNTFHASWHLDDSTNILDNANVHVTSLSLEEWSRSMIPPFSDPDKVRPGLSVLYRPVAMLTFALNWFIGGANVFGYHVVNIGLHCLTATLLYFTCLNLLALPNMHGRYKENAFFIAYLATALWALHPIQTQAVTYIVQRMTLLAAFFYLAGILFYVHGKKAASVRRKTLFFGLGLVSYLLAVGSKQNAITLPLAWLIMEIVFYRPKGVWKKGRIGWKEVGTVGGLAAFFILILFYWRSDPLSAIMQGYQMRPFTLSQRIMTEFRVLILHLGQLFYPIPQRFSIMHDLSLSTSLLKPWTTLGAASMVGTMVAAALLSIRRWPLLSWAILFYFLGHCVESTILPLELIFEHRNYLPSLFLFLPVAAGIAWLMDKYRNENKLVYSFLVAFAFLVVLGLGLGSHIRNSIWSDEKSLWQDALNKAPSLARPYQNLALALEREGELDAALRLYQKALGLKDPEPELSRFISLSNMGNIYRKKGDLSQAIHYLTEAVRVEKGPYKQRVRLNLALCLLNVREEDRALKQINAGLRQQPDNIHFLAAKGFILIRHEKTDEALKLFQQVLHRNPYDRDGLINMAMVMSSKGLYQRSEWFLKRAERRYPHNLIIHLGLLQNALAMEDIQRANQYMTDIAGKFSIHDINRYFDMRSRGNVYINTTLVSLDDAMIMSFMVEYFNKIMAGVNEYK